MGKPTIDFVGGQAMEEMGVNLKDMFGNLSQQNGAAKDEVSTQGPTFCVKSRRTSGYGADRSYRNQRLRIRA